MLAHRHMKVKHRPSKKYVHIPCKLFSTGSHSAFGSCSLSHKCFTPVPCGGDVRRHSAPQWVQQVAVCWIQQVASCSAVLPSQTACTAPSSAGPLPTVDPGRLTPAGVSGKHRARTRDLVSIGPTAVELGLSWRSNVSSARRDMSQIDIDVFVNCSSVDTRWQQYSTHLHTNNTQNDKKNHRTAQKQHIEQHKNVTGNSAVRAPSWRVIHWHLPYNWGKSTEKPQTG
jgi:hypothetical protein